MSSELVRGLRGAIAFLTRIPAGDIATNVDPAQSVPYVPLVGALIGLAIAGTYIATTTAMPRLPSAALAVTIGVLLTGALHEDGLADTADALGANSQADALHILRDPRHGTYGVLALSASFMLRITALASFNRVSALTLLPAAHALSRLAAVTVVAFGPPITNDGLAATYGPAVRHQPLVLCAGAAAIVATALLHLWVLAALGITASLTLASRQLAILRFGGINGDVGGACQQLAETGLLLLASAHPFHTWTPIATN